MNQEKSEFDSADEQKVMENYFRLIRVNRSEYEARAKTFLSNPLLDSETDDYKLKFFIRENLYTCVAKPKSDIGVEVTLQSPIPETHEAQIEELVSLFAQSEAGFASGIEDI
ncbi:MAG: hypothetical protein RL029_886 [Actinomycetota bacterium]|jgi:hypothetical protein